MSLLNLWNTIRGRSRQDVATPAVAGSVDSTSKARAAPVTRPAKAAKPPRSGFRVFGGGSPHASLCKQLRKVSAGKVLEIGVEDGSRAIAVVQTLKQAHESVRYLAIDQFEMAGGATTLKQFHQTLRAANVRPQVFPEPIARGLIRVCHTIGTVDLVLIGLQPELWQTPEIRSLLSKVSHSQTITLYRDEDSWHQSEIPATETRRVA